MALNNVELELSDIEGSLGTTSPTVECVITARVNGRNSIIVDNIDAETTLRFPDSEKHINGSPPRIRYSQAGELGRHDNTRIPFLLPFSQSELEKIEKYREGGALTVEFDIWIRGRSDRSDDRNSERFTVSKELIDAEWDDILETVGYHEGRVFSIALDSDIQTRDTLATVNSYVSQAEEKHNRGDYPGAIVKCRQAVEALLSIDSRLEEVLDDRKYDELTGLLEKFKTGYLGGMAHAEEMTNVGSALRRDSDFAIGITKTCVRYASTALEEETQ